MGDTQLLSRERQNMIRKRLAAEGRVNAGTLARLFGVSEDTVRRDLRDLAAEGVCERVYGGAISRAVTDVPLSVRIGENASRKAALAAASVQLVKSGMSVFFDAGSTNLAIARALPRDIALHAATNAPVIAAALIDHARIDVVMIGGRIEPSVGGAVDAKALRDVEAFVPDLTVLGACGLDERAGITSTRFDDAVFKRHVAERSRSIVAAVMREKIGAPHPYAVMPLGASLTVVVEHDTSDAEQAAIIAQDAAVLRAAPPTGR